MMRIDCKLCGERYDVWCALCGASCVVPARCCILSYVLRAMRCKLGGQPPSILFHLLRISVYPDFYVFRPSSFLSEPSPPPSWHYESCACTWPEPKRARSERVWLYS
eukprot:4270431-Pyramimonas_sp.AAC.1